MATTAQKLAVIRRIDGADACTKYPVDSIRGSNYVEAYWKCALESKSDRGEQYRRADQGLPSATRAVDPNDRDHTGRAGSNAAAQPSARDRVPDGIGEMDLQAVKGLCMSVSAYGSGAREEIARQCLDRLRALGAPQVADMFEDAFAYTDLSKLNDLEHEQLGAAAAGDEVPGPHVDADEDEELNAVLAQRSASRNAWREPGKVREVAQRTAGDARLRSRKRST